jgi:hypothetical protein
VTSIGIEAFKNCEKLKTIPSFENVTSIGDYAFCNCEQLETITLSDLLVSVGSNIFSAVPLRTLNLVGKKPGGNGISDVCGLLSTGQGQSGSITTFNFSLGVTPSNLNTYIDGVLALNKASIPLLSSITSGTLDLCGAEVEMSSLSAPGTLINRIKQGEQIYTWNGSAWV